MSNAPTVPEIEIASSNIPDLEAFEEARAHAYQTTDLAERKRELGEIMAHTETIGGVLLGDVVLEKVTRPNNATGRAFDEVEEISNKVANIKDTKTHHDETTYQFVLDNAGEVEDVRKITPLKLNKKATNSAQKTSDKVGWGPSQNYVHVHADTRGWKGSKAA